MGPIIGGYSEGQTPLDEEHGRGLKIEGISRLSELDEFEQRNIERALLWLLQSPPKKESVLTEPFIRTLHVRMFGNVWNWAGKQRAHTTNIGVDWWTIPIEVRKMLEDADYWHQNETFEPDEWAIRIKHRLVSIHCFPNGNGRHSRLFADVLVESYHARTPFTWGKNRNVSDAETRSAYLQCLRQADRGDFSPLVAFART
jgi:Fic-DOC domain mobile mystery protein B